MLRLPRLQHIAMCVLIQYPSCSGLTLMTSAPRSASIIVPHGPATASPRSSTRIPARGDPGAPIDDAASVGDRAPARRVGFGPHRVGVGAHRPRRGGRVGRTRVQLVDPSDLSHRPERRVDHLGDTAVGDERGIVERLLR